VIRTGGHPRASSEIGLSADPDTVGMHAEQIR